MDFSQVSRIDALSPGRFLWQVPDGWQQGRGAFGGLVLAALLRAMEAMEPDRTRVTRSLTGDLCGPVQPGPAELVVEVLRRGNNLSNLDARLIQGGEVQARASAVLSAAKAGAQMPAPLRPPAATPFDSLPELSLGPPDAPVFTPHFEYRSFGPAPFDPGPGGPLGWLRLRHPPPRLDAPALIALLDAWWPAIFDGRPRPMATVSFTAEVLVAPAELDPAAPLLYTGRVAGLHDGFCVEFRELWSGDRPVALNQQTFAILREARRCTRVA